VADEGRYKLLCDLPDREFAALMNDISANGLRRPIAVDEHGNTLDGFQRQRACDMLGLECRREEHAGLEEIDKLRFVVQANPSRVTGTVRMLLAAELTRRGHSQRRVAYILGVHQPQVSEWLKGASDLPDTVVGSDGKVQEV